MASGPSRPSPFGELTSGFDDMLRDNRTRLDQQWDALAGGTPAPREPARPAPEAPTRTATARAGRGTPLRRSGEYVSASRVWDAAKSESARALDARYGDAWEFEVASMRREGDEFLVLGKLSIPSRNIVKSQFGRGRIPGTAADAQAASAGGKSFRFGGSEPAPSGGGGQSAEDRGYRRAIEDALAQCMTLL